LFIILLITQYPESSDDKLRSQILSVGTTANAGLRLITDVYHYYIISIVNYDIPQYYIISIVNYDIPQYYIISIVNYDIPQYYIISIVNYDIPQYYMW
jgi:uncharacterized membrane protein YkvI